MQIVIDIPEEWYYDMVKEEFTKVDELCGAVQLGIVLPKGHGTLKDTDKLTEKINYFKDDWDYYGNEYEIGRYESYDYAVDMIEDAPTIIKADKEE